MRKSFDTLGVGDLQRQLGALDERLRVVRILRDLRPHDAVNDNEMARLCVELFRAYALDAINPVPEEGGR